MRGIDVSSNNHPGGAPIAWDRVAAAGIQFAVVKASEGLTYRNPDLAADYVGALGAGLVACGLYHYARPSTASGHDEATAFLAAIRDNGGLRPGTFLALDLEDVDVAPNADLLAYALDWLATTERQVGITPFLYCAHWYLAPHNLEGHAELARFPLWLASWQPTRPDPPPIWPRVAIWQRASNGRVDGIAGLVDLDVFDGTADDLLRGHCWGY